VWMAPYNLEDKAQLWYMQVQQDEGIPTWRRFKDLLNLRYGPPLRSAPLFELAKCRSTGTVEEYQDRFQALLPRAGPLGEAQRVQLFTRAASSDQQSSPPPQPPNPSGGHEFGTGSGCHGTRAPDVRPRSCVGPRGGPAPCLLQVRSSWHFLPLQRGLRSQLLLLGQHQRGLTASRSSGCLLKSKRNDVVLDYATTATRSTSGATTGSVAASSSSMA
jgi:hypothetical protein